MSSTIRLQQNPPSEHASKKFNNSSETLNQENISQSLFNPELLSKRSVIINTSTSKAMYGFSKAARFHPVSKDNSPFFYNLPSMQVIVVHSLAMGKKQILSLRLQVEV